MEEREHLFLAARHSRHAGTGGVTRRGRGAAQPYRLLWDDAYQTHLIYFS